MLLPFFFWLVIGVFQFIVLRAYALRTRMVRRVTMVGLEIVCDGGAWRL